MELLNDLARAAGALLFVAGLFTLTLVLAFRYGHAVAKKRREGR